MNCEAMMDQAMVSPPVEVFYDQPPRDARQPNKKFKDGDTAYILNNKKYDIFHFQKIASHIYHSKKCWNPVGYNRDNLNIYDKYNDPNWRAMSQWEQEEYWSEWMKVPITSITKIIVRVNNQNIMNAAAGQPPQAPMNVFPQNMFQFGTTEEGEIVAPQIPIKRRKAKGSRRVKKETKSRAKRNASLSKMMRKMSLKSRRNSSLSKMISEMSLK